MKYQAGDKVLFRGKVWTIIRTDGNSHFPYRLSKKDRKNYHILGYSDFWVREQDLIDITNIEEARKWLLSINS